MAETYDPHGWLDQRVAELERLRKKYGLNADISLGPLRYNWGEIERQIMVLLNRNTSLPVSHPDTIPDAFVNALADTYLACYVAAQEPPPWCLGHLISRQLKTMSFGQRPRRRQDAFDKALQYLFEHKDEKITKAELARQAGVHRADIGRWWEELHQRVALDNIGMQHTSSGD